MLSTSQGLKDDPSLLEDWKKDMNQILVKAQGNQVIRRGLQIGWY